MSLKAGDRVEFTSDFFPMNAGTVVKAGSQGVVTAVDMGLADVKIESYAGTFLCDIKWLRFVPVLTIFDLPKRWPKPKPDPPNVSRGELHRRALQRLAAKDKDKLAKAGFYRSPVDQQRLYNERYRKAR